MLTDIELAQLLRDLAQYDKGESILLDVDLVANLVNEVILRRERL